MFVAARHAIEGTNRARLTINQQLEVITVEAIDKPPLLIDDGYVGLNEFGVGAENFVGSSRRLLLSNCRRREECRHN